MSFYENFKPDIYTIKDFKNWVIILREKQVTLGSAVIILKNEYSNIGLASKDDFCEFPEVINWYENKCKELFDAEKFNYLAAMMKDNFVHFHAFPRYSKSIEIKGTSWKDEFWPGLVDTKVDKSPENTLKELLDLFTK